MENKNLSQQKTLTNEPKCELCGDIGVILSEKGSKMCQCQKNKIKEQYVGFFKDVDLMKINPKNESQKRALEIIKLNPTGCYYLFGEVRTGKTHLIAGMFNYIIDSVTVNARWYRDKDLKEMFRDAEIHHTDITYEITNGDIQYIFIDDIGKVVANDFVMQEMYRFIDEIYIRNCKLILSSIFSLEELVGIYGISTVRRIEDIVDRVIKLKE